MRTPTMLKLGSAVLLGVLVAACGHVGSSSGSAAARASASAKASALASTLKHDSKLMHDEQKALAEVESCAKSQAGLTVVLPMPGSSTQPSISGVTFHDAEHPIATVEAIVRCTPAGAHGAKGLDKCVKQVALGNGIGRGKLMADLNDAATVCVAGIKS